MSYIYKTHHWQLIWFQLAAAPFFVGVYERSISLKKKEKTFIYNADFMMPSSIRVSIIKLSKIFISWYAMKQW